VAWPEQQRAELTLGWTSHLLAGQAAGDRGQEQEKRQADVRRTDLPAGPKRGSQEAVPRRCLAEGLLGAQEVQGADSWKPLAHQLRPDRRLPG